MSEKTENTVERSGGQTPHDTQLGVAPASPDTPMEEGGPASAEAITQRRVAAPDLPPPLTDEQYRDLRIKAGYILRMDRIRNGLGNMLSAFARDGFPEEAFAVQLPEAEDPILPSAFISAAKGIRETTYRELRSVVKGSALHWLVESTPGLGPACYLFAGMLPKLSEMRSPYAVFKYAGLHVTPEGRAPRRRKGGAREDHKWSPQARAVAIVRIGDPVIRATGGSYERADGTTIERKRSPYRDVYDDRREVTMVKYPPMQDADGELLDPECEHCLLAMNRTREERDAKRQTRERTAPAHSCKELGGMHMTPGHRHNDAVRVMVKAVLLDLWRVENGQLPRVGGQTPSDPQKAIAPGSAA